MAAALLRVPVFPLAGALLFPRGQLPLHIFEPRYRAMVRDALASDRLIAMVQPKEPAPGQHDREPPALFEVGCLGRIGACEELDDGRFNIVLEGLSRFRIAREAEVDTLYRQVDADRSGFTRGRGAGARHGPARRGRARGAALCRRARLYGRMGAGRRGSTTRCWSTASPRSRRSTSAPSRRCSKRRDLADRADLLVQFMQFQRMAPGGADGPETLQ